MTSSDPPCLEALAGVCRSIPASFFDEDDVFDTLKPKVLAFVSNPSPYSRDLVGRASQLTTQTKQQWNMRTTQLISSTDKPSVFASLCVLPHGTSTPVLCLSSWCLVGVVDGAAAVSFCTVPRSRTGDLSEPNRPAPTVASTRVYDAESAIGFRVVCFCRGDMWTLQSVAKDQPGVSDSIEEKAISQEGECEAEGEEASAAKAAKAISRPPGVTVLLIISGLPLENADVIAERVA